MKSIIVSLSLIFSVGLLIGCSGQKKAAVTDPALSLAEVADLAKCTNDQRDNLETVGVDGNKPDDSDFCVHVDDDNATESDIQDEFETLRDVAAGSRSSCKWLYRRTSTQPKELWYCTPEEMEQ